MEKVSRVMKRLTPSFGNKIPVIHLRGPISRQMCNYLTDRLESVRKSHRYLAVVVNSKGGSFAQAHIISKKLQQSAKQYQLQLLTFAQEFALNAGLVVLLSGNKVYVDTTTALGGLSNGESITRYGKVTQMISNINYANESSFTAGVQQSGSISHQKGQQLTHTYQQFSKQMQQQLRKSRYNKINPQFDLTQLFSAEAAIKNGVVDQIGRLYNVLPALDPQAKIQLLRVSKIEKIKNLLKKVNSYKL